MGGRGAVSGSNAANMLIQQGAGSGKTTSLDISAFTDLGTAERAIQNRDVENLVIFNNPDENAIYAATGNGNSVAVPSDPKMLKNAILTHNHPDDKWGGTFSFADIGVATKYDVKSIRAVGGGSKAEGVYILSKNKNARPLALAQRVYNDKPKLENMMSSISKRISYQVSSGKCTVQQSRNMYRQLVVGALHSYYKSIAPQYGYTYTRMK